ncbi:MAG: molecular chaperone DnaJ [Dongiaceae bacterium]
MAKQDYYELLGISRTADGEDIKRAFRKLAKECHPDRNPGCRESESKFKAISEAYDVLRDGEKRAAYDRFGHGAFDPTMGGGFDVNGGFGFADIFEEMFGDFMGGRRGGATSRGADLRYNLEITLEEAYGGKEATLRVPSSIVCKSCDGTGSKDGKAPVTCKGCQGSGKVRASQGFFTIERTCATCQGMGRVVIEACAECQATGRTRKDKTLSVNIPAGVEDGTRIRLTGEGEMGLRGGPPGDLYVFLNIKAHPLFRREGANIFCRVPISMSMAALGGTIEVPALGKESAKVTIPPGTQSSQQFRLKNQGMSILRSSARGDMYVEVAVETPVNLTKRQKELLKEFADSEKAADTSPQVNSFFAQVKEFLEGLKN